MCEELGTSVLRTAFLQASRKLSLKKERIFFFFFLSSYMYLFPFLSVVKQFSMQNIVSSLSPLAPAQQADNFLLGKRE